MTRYVRRLECLGACINMEQWGVEDGNGDFMLLYQRRPTLRLSLIQYNVRYFHFMRLGQCTDSYVEQLDTNKLSNKEHKKEQTRKPLKLPVKLQTMPLATIEPISLTMPMVPIMLRKPVDGGCGNLSGTWFYYVD